MAADWGSRGNQFHRMRRYCAAEQIPEEQEPCTSFSSDDVINFNFRIGNSYYAYFLNKIIFCCISVVNDFIEEPQFFILKVYQMSETKTCTKTPPQTNIFTVLKFISLIENKFSKY